MLVGGLVLVGDAVAVEPVGDLELLEALHLLALQGAQVELLDLRVPLVLGLEVPFRARVVEEMGEPSDDHLGHLGGGRHEIAQDGLDQRKEGHVVRGMIGERGLLPLDRADDVVGERVEGPRLDRNPAARLDPLRHFLGRVAGEGQKQDLVGRPDAGLDQVGGLGGDDAGLARPRARKDKGGILVHHDREALFGREGLRLDRVEEVLPAVELRLDVPLDGRGTQGRRIGREPADRGQTGPVFRSDGLRAVSFDSRVPVQLCGQVLCLAQTDRPRDIVWAPQVR